MVFGKKMVAKKLSETKRNIDRSFGNQQKVLRRGLSRPMGSTRKRLKVKRSKGRIR